MSMETGNFSSRLQREEGREGAGPKRKKEFFVRVDCMTSVAPCCVVVCVSIHSLLLLAPRSNPLSPHSFFPSSSSLLLLVSFRFVLLVLLFLFFFSLLFVFFFFLSCFPFFFHFLLFSSFFCVSIFVWIFGAWCQGSGLESCAQRLKGVPLKSKEGSSQPFVWLSHGLVRG